MQLFRFSNTDLTEKYPKLARSDPKNFESETKHIFTQKIMQNR